MSTIQQLHVQQFSALLEVHRRPCAFPGCASGVFVLLKWGESPSGNIPGPAKGCLIIIITVPQRLRDVYESPLRT